MSVYKRGKGTHWHYYFRVRGVRYRGSIPEARTKQKAEQAESKIKQEIFEKRFELEQKGTDLLSDFLDDVYLPWSKVNKKSWRDDVYMVPMLKAHFEGKALRDISVQLVERFKTNRMNTPTKKGTARQPATVNRELNLLSSAFSLAVTKLNSILAAKLIFSRSIIFATDICYPKKNRDSWPNSAGHAPTLDQP